MFTIKKSNNNNDKKIRNCHMSGEYSGSKYLQKFPKICSISWKLGKYLDWTSGITYRSRKGRVCSAH